jgi:hypothetical protein
MIRIIIEIDGREVSSTIVQPPGSLGAPPELLERAAALGATDAGSAPGGMVSVAALFDSAAAIDAGTSREEGASGHTSADEGSDEPKR